MTTSAPEILRGLEDLAFFERALFGKARRQPSIMEDAGFIRELIQVANGLINSVARDTNDLERRVRRSTRIDWPKSTPQERTRAVREMVRLISGAPSAFAPGIKAELKRSGVRVVQSAHGAEASKNPGIMRIDPVFATRNQAAVDAMVTSTSVFFSPEYARRARGFGRRAQDTIARGLNEGLGREAIARKLEAEFGKTVAHRSYWETVAAIHVNRARSFGALATYSEAGVENYEIVAVRDERTTEVCLMMHGTILSVQRALDAFEEFEKNANDRQAVDRFMPFMRASDKAISLPDGARVASIGRDKDGNATSFPGKLSASSLQDRNVGTPPYHYRCRTTVIPVLSDQGPSRGRRLPKPITNRDGIKQGAPNPWAKVPPPDVSCPKCGVPGGHRCVTSGGKEIKKPHNVRLKKAGIQPPPVVGPGPEKPKPETTGPERSKKKPKKKAGRGPRSPENPGPDPVARARTPAAKRRAIVKQVRNRLGFVPGQLSGENRFAILGQRTADQAVAMDKLSEKLAKEYRKIGREMLEFDPDLKKSWNGLLKTIREDRKNSTGETRFRLLKESEDVAERIISLTKNMGSESIRDPNERARRRREFQERVIGKLRRGRVNGKPITRGKNANLAREYAGEFFDAWGPVAESSLSRNDTIIKLPPRRRAWNNTILRQLGYTDRRDFHHEMAHSVEHHVNSVRAGDRGGQSSSYWVSRVKARHDGPIERLRDVIPGSGYAAWEETRKDRWADPYMGKIYENSGSTEVVSVFAEMFGGAKRDLIRQMSQDPEAIEEFLGYMRAVIDGETTRRNRGGR